MQLSSEAIQWRLRATTFLSSFDRFAIPPLLVPISHAFGVPLGTAALVASAYFIAYGVSQPFWGALSDRVGRVKVIRFAIVAGAVCCIVAAVAPSFTVLLVSRTISGLLFAAIVPTVVTYIGDTVDVEHRQHALTLTIASASAGIAVATIVGGLCAQLISWRAAFLATSILAFLLSLALTRIPEPERVPSPHTYLRLAINAIKKGWVVVVLVIGFIEGAVILGSLTFVSASLQKQGVGAAVAGAAAAGFGIANVCCVPVVTRAIKRIASPLMITIGSFLAAAALLLAAADTLVATAILAAIGLGAGFGFLHPTMQLWATQVNAQARAVTVSFFAGSVFVGGAVASAGAAPLANGGHFSAIFFVAAVLAVLLATVAAWLRARYVRAVQGDPAAGGAPAVSL